MRLRRSKPQIVMETRGRLALRRKVSVAANLAIAPSECVLQLTDAAIANEFLHAIEIREGVALHADLRGELALLRLPRGAHRARFVHRDRKRLLAIDVQVPLERPVRHEGVAMVRGADDDGIETGMIQRV